MRNFGDFLEQPVADLAGPILGADLRARDSVHPGERFGDYRVIRELGRGGMGVVCLAERRVGDDTEKVALKVILKRFAIEPSTLRRFREERQMLAPLDHPGIVRVLDGGEADGVPWFAMEYVEGIPIDEYCAERALDVRGRLELFARACDAVDHAHQLAIVHRDIKPKHILVTADGVVKLLDFGIAKLAVPDGDVGPHDPTFTQPQLLTPAYASPEQLRGERASTASDVYSLGVLLYRMLTGRLPLRRALDVVRRSKPRPHLPPPSLGPRFPKTLDRIVGTALQSDREARYPSAGSLAADVRAYLAGVPVIARRSRSSSWFGRMRDWLLPS
ncbi:MAG TPA: serine/threonine-protein kinase [Gemmatimonadaceae bacterium]|nr:serine/threonine-protein kinase [Gemmatimonadaceae bacterium]